MERVRYFVRRGWVDRHLTQWITAILVAINIGLGTAIIAGGPGRFNPPSYSPLHSAVHGDVWVWGGWIIFAGLLMTVPFRWVNMAGIWLTMFFNIIWMGAFSYAVINYSSASPMLLPLHGGLAMISAALLTARVVEKLEE